MIKKFLSSAARTASYYRTRLLNPSSVQHFGIDVPLHATEELRRARRSIYRGGYERPELEALQNLLRPTDVVLELGAGLGVVSTFIAKHLASPDQFTTVEANPNLLPSINAVSARNGVTLKVIQGAVGTEDGTADFYFSRDYLSSSSRDRGLGVEPTKVKTLAFDRLLESVRPSVIVFDIEGAEVEIFAKALPETVRMVCGEMHPHIVGDEPISRILGSLIQQGFVLRIDQSEGRAFALERG